MKFAGMNMKVRDLIRSKRIKLNFSQAELARQLNVSSQLVNQIEKGSKKLPVSLIRKTAKVLQLSIQSLIDAKIEETREEIERVA